MNKKEIAEAILVMEAWRQDESIQIRDKSSECRKWRPIGTEYQGAAQPTWDWEHDEYRIKPKPREFWIDPQNTLSANHVPAPDENWILVREVL